MNKTEKLVKDYSSKKLKEISEQHSSIYSKNFVDSAKDELIKRGETFTFDVELENKVAAMSDSLLTNLINNDWYNFHLEYLEIARKEFLKRKLINNNT